MSPITLPTNDEIIPVVIVDANGNALASSNQTDVADRAGRLLGHVAAIDSAVDISDRGARLLGHVTPDGVLDQATTGVVNAAGDTVALATRPGDASWMVFIGAGGGTIAFECSFDGGATFVSAVMARGDAAVTNPAPNASANNTWYESALPAGTTHVRARCTTTPTAPPRTVIVATSRAQYEPILSLTGTADVSDRAARLLGHVAAIDSAVDISDRATRALGHTVNDQGIADSLSARGLVTVPAAGGTIVTLAAPPAGVYNVEVTTLVSGTSTADRANLRLQRQGVTLSDLLAGDTMTPTVARYRRVTLSGAQNLTVIAVAAGTAGTDYAAQIVATQLA